MTLWTVVHQAPLSMEFSRQEYWSGLPFLLQGSFLTQRLNCLSEVSFVLFKNSILCHQRHLCKPNRIIPLPFSQPFPDSSLVKIKFQVFHITYNKAICHLFPAHTPTNLLPENITATWSSTNSICMLFYARVFSWPMTLSLPSYLVSLSKNHGSLPLFIEGASQDLQWMPETADSIKSHIYYIFFSYIYIPMIKFNLYIWHSKSLTMITYNKTK